MVGDLDEAVVRSLAEAVTGRPGAGLGHWSLTPAAHRVENMTTRCLDRLVGTLADGTPWSVFAKTLQPASASPGWASIPEQFHAMVLEELHWLDEPRVYGSGLRDGLPDGLRMPLLHRVDRTASHVTLWLEDVADAERWDIDRYQRAGAALGRLAGRWPEDRAAVALGMRRRPLDRLWSGKITFVDLAAQADDRFWADPAVAAVVDARHRSDLQHLAEAMPHLLARLALLPHGMAHGDATPANLHEPGDGSIVAIDWSYGSCAPLGSDLGQLVAGRVESGATDPSALEDVAAAAFAGYLEGLALEGCHVDPEVVEEGWATSLAVRSVFSALLLDHRPDLPDVDRRALLARRCALGRFGLDLAARVTARL